MKNFFYQVNVNYKRIVWRNKRFFFFSLALPVIFYLLFTKVMNVGVPANVMKEWQLNELVQMAIYSSLISSVIVVSNTLLEDREHHFTLFVRLTNNSYTRYYAGMLAVFLPLTILAVVVLGLVGILVNGVSASTVLWLSFIILLPLLSIPLVLMGMLISLASAANLVNLLNQITMFFMAIVSGLWWPIDMLPSWLQTIGKILPTYQISTIITEVMNKKAVELGNFIGLLLWTIFLFGALLVAFKFIRRREMQVI